MADSKPVNQAPHSSRACAGGGRTGAERAKSTSRRDTPGEVQNPIGPFVINKNNYCSPNKMIIFSQKYRFIYQTFTLGTAQHWVRRPRRPAHGNSTQTRLGPLQKKLAPSTRATTTDRSLNPKEFALIKQRKIINYFN